MRTAAFAFVSATVAAAVLTPAVREWARRRGAMDHALTSRKIHTRPVPRLGGIAIVLAFYVPLLGLLFVTSDVGARFLEFPRRTLGLFVGGLAIAALGIYDDLKGARARVKLLVQLAVAALMYALNFRIDQIALPFGEPIQLGLLGLPFTMLWIAGVVNAMNLMDGLDGLAGGVAFIAFAAIFTIAGVQGSPLMMLFAAAIAGAVLGFLFYNFNPASIFMGDTGSMFLGFVLATTSIQTNHKSSAAVAMLVPVLLLGVPIADTLLAMGRRAVRGLPMFAPDRGHIHHRLMDRGLTQRQTVLVLYGASTLLGLAALGAAVASPRQALASLASLGVLAFLGLRRLGFFHLAHARRVLEARRRNLSMQGAVRRAGQEIQAARDLDDVWLSLRFAAVALGASAVALRLSGPHPVGAETYSDGFGADGELLVARYGLVPERPGEAHVELGWSDGRATIDRDTEIAIELLLAQAANPVTRLSHRPAPALHPVREERRAGTAA
jgi:UDP-GlcNAc:undecaprenyl-phosphate GlcNAc-1-phosphate transferase